MLLLDFPGAYQGRGCPRCEQLMDSFSAIDAFRQTWNMVYVAVHHNPLPFHILCHHSGYNRPIFVAILYHEPNK
jgi:hypothetical protein